MLLCNVLSVRALEGEGVRGGREGEGSKVGGPCAPKKWEGRKLGGS